MSLEKIEIRKIVPVAARISAGKTKLLNVLYNIKFLECKDGIATKFINLLRYTPEISQPRFYHLLLKKEGETYTFYKDPNEYYEGEENIIEANKNINNKLYGVNDIKYENIFYMTEINTVPFIKDKDYLLEHDLCDVPGLTECQSTPSNVVQNNQTTISKSEVNLNKANGQKNKKRDIVKDINSQKKEKDVEMIELTNFDQKEEDEIYYNTNNIEKNTYLSEIFGIIKDYIDGAIIIFSIDNYYFEDNFELIVKLYKVTNKKIMNFLVILNKMDRSTDPVKDKEKFKAEVFKHFPKGQTFNLNSNTFIPLSLMEVENELSMNKSFRHLIYYHFYNYYSDVKVINCPKANIPNFINHLKDFIVKYFENININECKKEIDKFGDAANNEICSIMKDLFNEFKSNEKINFGFYESDFNGDNNDKDEDSENEEEQEQEINNNIENLKPFTTVQLIYLYHKEEKLNISLSDSTEELINYFSNKTIKNTFDSTKKEEKEVETDEMILSNKLNLICDKITKSKIDISKIKSLIEEIIDTSEFLKQSNYIFIPFLGPSNAGKTTIINGIIGRDILPTDLNECTKRGIIIRYSDEVEDDITISTSDFIQVKYLDKINYYFNEGLIIGKGLSQVKNTLKSLSYEFTDKEEDSFYYIKTKIKLFDEFGLSDSLKKKIYLIDIPGYGTSNKFLEKERCKKIINISSSFIFVLKNAVIKENNTKSILDYIFNETKVQKKQVSSGIINSCSFILNNEKSQSTGEEDLIKAKKDIQQIIGYEYEKDQNDINLSFFNAKYYIDYCNILTYFFNLEETFENEYNSYKSIKQNRYKYPRLYGSKKSSTFLDYLYKQLNGIYKNKFGSKKNLNSHNINDDVKERLNAIYDDLTQKQYINEEEVEKRGKKILQIFSYCQDKIKELTTLKESNIDNLKILLNSQFNLINNNIKEELNSKIEKIISTLDEFIQIDSSNEKPRENKEIEAFKSRMEKITNVIKNLGKENAANIYNIFDAYKKFLEIHLNEKKNDIENILKDDKCQNILNKIDEEIKIKLKDLNDKIGEIIEGFNKKTVVVFEEANKEIREFSQGKTKLELYTDFINYLKKEIGVKNKYDLYEQLFIEIKSYNRLSKIYESKGFINFLKSIVSNSSYLSNNLDIILNDFTEKVNYISSLILNNLNKYVKVLLHLISKAIEIVSIKFSDEQLAIWKQIKTFYLSQREEIVQAKNKLIET